jgi:hypothetical protein
MTAMDLFLEALGGFAGGFAGALAGGLIWGRIKRKPAGYQPTGHVPEPTKAPKTPPPTST